MEVWRLLTLARACKSKPRGSQLDAKQQQQLEEEEDWRVPGEEEGAIGGRTPERWVAAAQRKEAPGEHRVGEAGGGAAGRWRRLRGPRRRRGGLARAKCAPLALRKGGPGEVMLRGVGERNSQRGGVLCK